MICQDEPPKLLRALRPDLRGLPASFVASRGRRGAAYLRMRLRQGFEVVGVAGQNVGAAGRDRLRDDQGVGEAALPRRPPASRDAGWHSGSAGLAQSATGLPVLGRSDRKPSRNRRNPSMDAGQIARSSRVFSRATVIRRGSTSSV